LPSHRANAHGTACEYALAERYHVDLRDGDGKRIDTSWYDGRKNGTPWEFKATKYHHADGQPGNFKVYKRYHGRLVKAGGRYGFAVYRKRGTGTEVLKMKAVAASSLPMLKWHGGGSHRDTKQAKIDIDSIF